MAYLSRTRPCATRLVVHVAFNGQRVGCWPSGMRSHFKAALAANPGLMGAADLGLLSPMASATLHDKTTLTLLLETLLGPRPRGPKATVGACSSPPSPGLMPNQSDPAP